MDHVGGLSRILKESPHKIEALAHKDERPYIQGEQLPIKMKQSSCTRVRNTMPAEQLEKLKMIYQNKVDKAVSDGEELPYNGGIIIIHTPGHTPGHISLFLKESKILITGDALNVVDGKLLGPTPQFTFNMYMALNSLKKLAQYDIETLICYHSGLYKHQVNRSIAELAR